MKKNPAPVITKATDEELKALIEALTKSNLNDLNSNEFETLTEAMSEVANRREGAYGPQFINRTAEDHERFLPLSPKLTDKEVEGLTDAEVNALIKAKAEEGLKQRDEVIQQLELAIFFVKGGSRLPPKLTDELATFQKRFNATCDSDRRYNAVWKAHRDGFPLTNPNAYPDNETAFGVVAKAEGRNPKTVREQFGQMKKIIDPKKLLKKTKDAAGRTLKIERTNEGKSLPILEIPRKPRKSTEPK